MCAQTVLSRRSMLGAALALGICGVSAFVAQPAQAEAEGISLLDDLEPYESKEFVDNIGSFTMAGDTYSGVKMPYASYALYNLKGNYTELRFTLGHVDKTKKAYLAVYLDDVLYKDYSVTGSDLPAIVQIPLEGVQSLKLVSDDMFAGGTVGIANPTLFADAPTADTIPDGDYESEVMENGNPVTVKVTIANGLVSSLNIVSESESASLPTLYKALGNIISANSVEAAPAKETESLFSAK